MGRKVHHISRERLTVERIDTIIKGDYVLELSEEAKHAIVACREFLDQKVERSVDPIYGINTGFGSLCDTEIDKQDLQKLQRNLVISHACGMGEKVPNVIVKIMLLLKVQSLSYGHSGVQLETVERLIGFFNNDIYPIIYTQGSLGASGDLAPLAHLSLPLLGLGEVMHYGAKRTGEKMNEKMGWEPIVLQSKEGLALLNGTQFMSAYSSYILMELRRLSAISDVNAAMSIEAFDGRIEAFDPLVHEVRPHNGQKVTAKNIRLILEGSELIRREKKHVQDPYCLRCVPQVHGASKDTFAYVNQVVETEINSVTDNPVIFESADKIISAGNFHGQPLALVMDFVAIAMSELASISERRVYKLVSGQRGLPAFLVKNPGLNSGFMIAQYAAASAVSQNKQLCTPASVDTIDSSNGQEDHVSMGANAATKAYKVLKNLENVLSIEWFAAAQGYELRNAKEKTSNFLREQLKNYRKEVDFVEEDIEMYKSIKATNQFLKTRNVRCEVDGEILKLKD
jgi:histidine ammonia-lyase